MSLATVRAALAAAIDNISGLRVHGKRPNRINPPAAMIRRMRGVPHTTFAGNGMLRFEIAALVDAADFERAQADLDEYTDLSGTNSIVAAIEADPTLAGVAEYVIVGEWDEDNEFEYGGVPYLGARLPVEVHVTF